MLCLYVNVNYSIITFKKVAVKVINKREVLKRNYLRANLRREASMMQRMQHPHIIQLYEVMETENCYYIVMELIDGIEFVKYLSKKYYSKTINLYSYLLFNIVSYCLFHKRNALI